VTDQHGAGG